MTVPALRQLPTLEPHVLSELAAQAVRELLREGESPHTRASYRAALRYWAAWYALRYGAPLSLPLPVPCVLQFVVDHAQRTTPEGLRHELPPAIDNALVSGRYKGKSGSLALNTLVHRIAVLSKAHQAHGQENPCQEVPVRELLSRTRKAYARRGDVPRKLAALTKEPLFALLETCDDSLTGRRDRALLLFAWASGGRRRAEVANADIRFLVQTGPAAFSYRLAHEKTNPSGQDRPEHHKPIVGLAAEALQAWLEASGISEGRIFRQIRKGGHLAGSLSAAGVRDIVLTRCRQAGLEGHFSAHSLRSGFVTEASRQSAPLGETMAMTGHRSVSTLIGYDRLSNHGAFTAHMLEPRQPPADQRPAP